MVGVGLFRNITHYSIYNHKHVKTLENDLFLMENTPIEAFNSECQWVFGHESAKNSLEWVLMAMLVVLSTLNVFI